MDRGQICTGSLQIFLICTDSLQIKTALICNIFCIEKLYYLETRLPYLQFDIKNTKFHVAILEKMGFESGLNFVKTAHLSIQLF